MNTIPQLTLGARNQSTNLTLTTRLEFRRFFQASDLNTDLIGQMNRVYGRHPERAPIGRFDGDVGFIVE